MIQKLEMTVLIDNLAEKPLIGEWGLSILISADDRRMLLDTGVSDFLAQNAEHLDVRLDSVETGIPSDKEEKHAEYHFPVGFRQA